MPYTPPRLDSELKMLKETNSRLNRRCSILEGAVRQMWDACQKDGVRTCRRHDAANNVILEMEAGLLDTRDMDAEKRASKAFRHYMETKRKR